MPHRHRLETPASRPLVLRELGLALRAALARGYGVRDFKADLLAGVVVGIVALPLSMALAIASGVPPQYGLYTAIVAGAIIAALGGTSSNVSGPTAAFVVLLSPVAAKFGLGGLLVASVLAGVMLLGMGLMRFGRLIQYIPHPVTTGFTAGIGVVLATLQLKDFFGLEMGPWPEHFHERVVDLAAALPTVRWQDLSIGVFTLVVLLAWPKLTKRLPAPLVAIAFGAGFAALLGYLVDGFSVATIGSRFHYVVDGVEHAGIPRMPPAFDLPWLFPGADGQPLATDFGGLFGVVRELIGPAFAIAALGAIESLLCAVVADGMAGTKHDPDVELAAQGIGNIVAPFFGGFAATGAIARTATNLRAGSRTPISAMVHAGFVLAAVLALAPLLAYLPMASLAALLLVVAWNMSEARHFLYLARVAPKSDLVVLATCFSLTVLFDMVVSVSVGVVLAALLFMRSMSEIVETRRDEDHPHLRDPHLEGLQVYEIAGPMFFGAAEKAVTRLLPVAGKARAIILQMDAVPVIDVTGLVALESVIEKLAKAHTFVALAGVRAPVRGALERAGIVSTPGRLHIAATDEEALDAVRAHLAQTPRPRT
ncbi:MAG: C4-dicarboxylic acid transporter DauA [Planctomycetes bacterium]|nr:C4-dicarboxylic acid transporter DauA [Planctomycetota bacterium]